MSRSKFYYDLPGFARLYLTTHGIRTPADVRTERLADLFRVCFQLKDFPTLHEIADVCRELRIPIEALPDGADNLLGFNSWYEPTGPTIYIKPDLSIQSAETTLGHEVREVIENAFKAVRPSYPALKTHSKEMDQESDQFAGCLLMRATPTNDRLREIGFDLVRFASERERSLPSVIMRVRELYSSRGRYQGPVAGIWLFDADWNKVSAGKTTAQDLVARYDARLGGFSTDKSGSRTAKLANLMFPTRGMKAANFPAAKEAADSGRCVIHDVPCFDLFDEHNYFVAAEPLYISGNPWRVLVMVIRKDCLRMVAPWMARLEQSSLTAATSD